MDVRAALRTYPWYLCSCYSGEWAAARRVRSGVYVRFERFEKTIRRQWLSDEICAEVLQVEVRHPASVNRRDAPPVPGAAPGSGRSSLCVAHPSHNPTHSSARAFLADDGRMSHTLQRGRLEGVPGPRPRSCFGRHNMQAAWIAEISPPADPFTSRLARYAPASASTGCPVVPSPCLSQRAPARASWPVDSEDERAAASGVGGSAARRPASCVRMQPHLCR